MPASTRRQRSRLKPVCKCGCGETPARGAWASKNCKAVWDSGYWKVSLRQAVEKRDGGICAECRLDCIALQRQMKAGFKAYGKRSSSLGSQEELKLKYPWLNYRVPTWEPVLVGNNKQDPASYKTLCGGCGGKK